MTELNVKVVGFYDTEQVDVFMEWYHLLGGKQFSEFANNHGVSSLYSIKTDRIENTGIVSCIPDYKSTTESLLDVS